MTWFRVDDSADFHPKIVAAGNPAVGLWTRAGAYTSRVLSDGFVPLDIARAMGTRGQIQRLVDVGLWLPVLDGEGGFVFHEFTQRNPTRDQVEQRRRDTADRVRRWRENRDQEGDHE